MATRKGRSAGTVPAAAQNAPAPAAAAAPAPALAAKGGKKKAGPALSEKPVNVTKPLDMEQELAMLTAKLEEVTIQKQRTEDMLKEKDSKLQQSEEERAKLQKDMAKLQKQKAKAFNPELNVELLRTLVVKEDDAEGTAAGEGPDKKEKRDPRKPKRPLSAYLLWSQEMKSELPKGQAEPSKNLMEAWKALPEAEKQKYNQAHAQSMEAYNTAVAAYEKMLEEEKTREAALTLLHEQKAKEELSKLAQQFLEHSEEAAAESSRQAAKKKSKEKDPEKPKQPMTAFLHFCSDKRKTLAASAAAKGTKRDAKEEARIFSEEWNKIKDNEKARKKYDKLAAAGRERYAEEMEAYKAKKQEEEEVLKAENAKEEEQNLQEAMKLLKAKEACPAAPAPAATAAPLLVPVAGAPAAAATKGAKGKKGPSGYNLFQSAMCDSLHQAEPGITLGDLSRRLGQAWKDLNAEEKAKWNAKAEALAPAVQPAQPNDSSADFGI